MVRVNVCMRGNNKVAVPAVRGSLGRQPLPLLRSPFAQLHCCPSTSLQVQEAERHRREMELLQREQEEEKRRRQEAYDREQERMRKAETARQETERILREQQVGGCGGREGGNRQGWASG